MATIDNNNKKSLAERVANKLNLPFADISFVGEIPGIQIMDTSDYHAYSSSDNQEIVCDNPLESRVIKFII